MQKYAESACGRFSIADIDTSTDADADTGHHKKKDGFVSGVTVGKNNSEGRQVHVSPRLGEGESSHIYPQTSEVPCGKPRKEPSVMFLIELVCEEGSYAETYGERSAMKGFSVSTSSVSDNHKHTRSITDSRYDIEL